MRRERGPWVGLAVAILKPLLLALTRRDWQGTEHLPGDGGVVVCANHISYADPLTLAHLVWDSGRPPRFLAKSSLFDLPLAGRLLRGARQIPVYRDSEDAGAALSDAVAAVRAGECVCVYPEATLTRDPGLWPMLGKTGAARIALATGAPVVPVAQWGAHRLLPTSFRRPRLSVRRTVHVRVGAPLDLSDLACREVDAELLREATDRIMAAITELLGQLRPDEVPPVKRHDPGPAPVEGRR